MSIPMGQAVVQKDLIALANNKFAESIYFNRPEKQVVCFSTQLSCPVGCAFCASPGEEKTVNLSEEEMLTQISTMMNRYSDSDNIVLFSFMGEGEPLLNYANVLSVMHKLPKLYDNCKISLSTSGVAPDKIMDLAHEEFEVPFKLQVSIHAINAETRSWLIPHAKEIDEIKSAIEYYHKVRPERPVELNFALLEGVNDSIADADLIIDTFPTEYIKISQFNPIERAKFESPSLLRIAEFVGHLRDAGLTVEYHATDGSGIGAACGQTRGLRK